MGKVTSDMSSSLRELRAILKGRVIAPEDAGYDEARTVYYGGAEAGQRAIAPFRGLATPIVDMVRPMHYPEIYPSEEVGYHPVTAASSLFVDAVDHRAAEMIVDHLQGSPAPRPVAQIRVLGGAMARVPVEATAFAHRTRRIMVNVAAF